MHGVDGVLSYNMAQGERRGNDVDLYDFTYDGRVTDNYLTGGLGQLTDGVEGHHNFRLDPDDWGHKVRLYCIFCSGLSIFALEHHFIACCSAASAISAMCVVVSTNF